MDDLDSERQRKGATTPRETLPRSLAEGEVAALIEKEAKDATEVYLAVEAEDLARMIETGHPRERSSRGPAE